MARSLVKNASNPNPINLLINGAMDFWQRGVGGVQLSSVVAYTADRYACEKAGVGTLVQWDRSTNVPSNGAFPYSLQFTGGESGDTVYCFQRIEAALIRPYVGKTLTLSLWLQSSLTQTVKLQALTPVSGVVDQWSTDNSTSADITQANLSVSSTTTWTRFSISFIVPTAAENGLEVGIYLDANVDTGEVFRTTGWMLTEGPVAPANFYRASSTMQDELAACQRYYEKSYSLETTPGTVASAGQLQFVMPFAQAGNFDLQHNVMLVTKRASPTITIYSPTTGASGNYRNLTAGADQVGIGNNIGQSIFIFRKQNASAVTDQSVLNYHYTADSEL